MRKKILLTFVILSFGTIAFYSFREDFRSSKPYAGNTAMKYGLIKAWSVWIDGRLAPSDAVFGVPIFWWGRVGKVADFLAAILLLWDAGTSTWARAFSVWLRDSKAWWDHP